MQTHWHKLALSLVFVFFYLRSMDMFLATHCNTLSWTMMQWHASLINIEDEMWFLGQVIALKYFLQGVEVFISNNTVRTNCSTRSKPHFCTYMYHTSPQNRPNSPTNSSSPQQGTLYGKKNLCLSTIENWRSQQGAIILYIKCFPEIYSAYSTAPQRYFSVIIMLFELHPT